MVDCPERPCPACGKLLTGRQKSACSGRCRAEVSRRRKAQAQENRERRIQGLLEDALGLLLDQEKRKGA